MKPTLLHRSPISLKTLSIVLLATGLLLAPHGRAASFLEKLGLGAKKTDAAANALDLTGLTQDQMVSGLKEALGKGVEQAVSALGKEDGFLKDLKVKIPMPEGLKKIEQSLRTVRQDKLADEFIATMNRAAEQAVPVAAGVLGDSVKQMTLTDAKAILTSTNNAATEYFRRTGEAGLRERFLPIVKQATEKAGVTSAYKLMLEKASFARSFLNLDALDLDAYVTQKALDGLFVKIADEEKRIRENPVARTTDLLQKVFGAVKK